MIRGTILCVVLLSAIACGGDDGGVSQVDITINFNAVVGSEDARCGQSYDNLGTAGVTAELSFIQYYVSNVRLFQSGEEHAVTLDTNEFQTDGVALLDFDDTSGSCANADAAMNSSVTGTVVDGTFDEIAFDVGIPFDVNHDALSELDAPLNKMTMYWAWALGHRFLRVDFDMAGTPWNVHVGSIDCGVMGSEPPTSPCNRQNIAEIRMAFDPSAQEIALDVAELVSDSDLTANVGMTPGCQSFPDDEGDCTPIWPNLGLDYSTGACTNNCSGQTAFVARSR